MSLQSNIDRLVKLYDSPDYDPYDLAGDGDATVGMVMMKEMRDALEHLSDLMCRDCEGNGFVRNPHARYSEEYAHGRRTGQYSTNDPEEISCPRCGGVGFVAPKGIEKLPELYEVSEEPF